VSTAAAILRKLVAIPSVSAMSNRPMIDLARTYLDPRDWSLREYPHRDAAGQPKINLVAVTKNASGRSVELALVCHTDTVPFDPVWKEAVHSVMRKGRIYGRGSADVKGFLACILAAIGETDLRGLAKPLAVILTADEEIGCVGAKHLARLKAFRARYVLIGEPTGLRPIRAGKGYALAEIVVRGREAHSAFPAAGHSAIYDAARIVTRLEKLARKIATRKNRDFDPPYTTLNVGLIRGGTAKNIVPGECRITVEWRPIPGQDPEWVPGLIRFELKGCDARLDVQRLDPPFDPAPTNQLATLLASLSGNRAATVSFGTEAAHLRSIASEAVVFGPGDMTTAHKTGENVPVAELDKCVRYLRALIDRLCR
jgi:acetylornithine deacetylase